MLCFFSGHRNATTQLMPQLETAIKKHICDYSVTDFVVGQYGAFDRMAAHAVINAKKIFPEISLSILLPYHPAECKIHAPEGYDSTFYPPGLELVPRRLAIVRANQYMIMHSNYLIAYAWQPGSNAKHLLDYAKSRENKNQIYITNLALSKRSI